MAYVVVVSLLLISSGFDNRALWMIQYISLLMPLDNIFHGLRFFNFYIFSSYLGYNILTVIIAMLSHRIIKKMDIKNSNKTLSLAISLLVVLLFIAVGVYQHHLQTMLLDYQ